MLGLNSVFTKIDVAHYEDISADVLVCAEIFFKHVLNLGVANGPHEPPLG